MLKTEETYILSLENVIYFWVGNSSSQQEK